MKHLIDSQSLIWYVDQDHLLSAVAHAAITDPANELLLSAATIWEVAIKVGLGKLTLSMPFRLWMDKAVADLRLMVLPVTHRLRRCTADASEFTSRSVRQAIGRAGPRRGSSDYQ